MTGESDFIASLRGLAAHPAARGLMDDAAVLDWGGKSLVLTHDMIVEGVHFLPGDPADDVAWKLLAVNLSDLAAKGARPVGALLGYSLAADAEWDAAFVRGLKSAIEAFEIPLLGGDTVAAPRDSARAFGLTAIGEAAGPVPSRSGAKPGDILWVSGAVGDAGLGLAIAKGEVEGPDALLRRYRRPRPRLEAGQALAPLVTAMMDVSDGLLIDAARIAAAGDVRLRIALDDMPLSADFIASCGDGRAERLTAATSGDDYELLFAADEARSGAILALSESLGIPLSRIGRVEAGGGLRLADRDGDVPLPASLGHEHRPF